MTNTDAAILLMVVALSGAFYWQHRAQTARWLDKNDHAEIVSRRPMTERVLFGVSTALLAWLIGAAVVRFRPLLSDPGDWAVLLPFILLLCLPACCFLLGAGPRRLRLDVMRHRYTLTQGIPLLTWTKQGPTSGGELYISQTQSGRHQIRFRAPRWRFGLPLEAYDTDEQARSQARQIADKLDLNVRRRDVKCFVLVFR